MTSLHYNGRSSIISVWATKGVKLDRFCRAEGIKIAKGIMTGNIGPPGRMNITVTLNGLDFNTPDSLVVIEYIKKC